jgi:predicted O-methyltransferase YrrM
MTFEEALAEHFHIDPGNDNLPVLAKPRTGRDMGRHQIAKVLNDLGYRTAIEIGVGQGVSTVLWCKAISGLKLTGIDSYIGSTSQMQGRQDRYYSRAKRLEKRFDFQLRKMASMDAVDQFEDESVDFVNIDGDHTFDAVVQDIIRYVPKVRKGGLVMVHDYCAFKLAGVMKAVDAYTHCHRIDPWYVTQDCNPTAFWVRGAELA